MKFGILGDAKISKNQIIPAMKKIGFTVLHLGTRNPKEPVNLSYYKSSKIGHYEDVLADPEVEAVYIPLPNHLHSEWSIKALNAGKHVLCEKPIALSLQEIEAVEETATKNNRYFHEAFMVCHHPQWKWLKKLDIGEPLYVSAIFSYPPRPEGDIRNYAYMGGGPVFDIACYTILAGLILFESEPNLISCDLQMERNLDVEKNMNALVDFGDGKRLSMQVSSDMSLSQSVHMTGRRGWGRLDTPFNPGEIATASWAVGKIGEGTKKVFEPCNQYMLMLEHFRDSCRGNVVPSFKQSKQICKLLEQIIKFRD